MFDASQPHAYSPRLMITVCAVICTALIILLVALFWYGWNTSFTSYGLGPPMERTLSVAFSFTNPDAQRAYQAFYLQVWPV